MNMYELTSEYAALVAQYDEAEDDTERAEILTALDAINDGIANKAEAYARIIRNKTAEAQAYKAERDRLAARQKAAENVVANLKARLLDAMNVSGATEIGTSIGRWTVRTNSWSCTVTDEGAVPAEWRIPQPDKIDRAGILRHFQKTGEVIDGVDFNRTESLQFR